MSLSFFVPGVPVPEGSMKGVTLPGQKFTQLVPDNSAKLKPWRAKVTSIAALAIARQGWEKATGPVEVVFRFLLPMPMARPAALRSFGICFSWKKPDLDKLERAIGDAMTDAGVFVDDGQIAKSMTAKYEVREDHLAGVEVVVQSIDVDDDAVRETMRLLLERRRAAPRNRL